MLRPPQILNLKLDSLKGAGSAGLDGFLAIEKYILLKRGLFMTDRRREPNSWSLDPETRSEVDRLLILTDALSAS